MSCCIIDQSMSFAVNSFPARSQVYSIQPDVINISRFNDIMLKVVLNPYHPQIVQCILLICCVIHTFILLINKIQQRSNQVGFCCLYVIMLRRTFLFILSLLVIEEKAEIMIFVNGNFSLGKQTSPLKRHTEGAIKNEQSRETKC